MEGLEARAADPGSVGVSAVRRQLSTAAISRRFQGHLRSRLSACGGVGVHRSRLQGRARGLIGLAKRVQR